jgi:hypothetical protein
LIGSKWRWVPDFDENDLEQLLALEHAFCSLALISASNFAYLAEMKTK